MYRFPDLRVAFLVRCGDVCASADLAGRGLLLSATTFGDSGLSVALVVSVMCSCVAREIEVRRVERRLECLYSLRVESGGLYLSYRVVFVASVTVEVVVVVFAVVVSVVVAPLVVVVVVLVVVAQDWRTGASLYPALVAVVVFVG